MNRTDRTLIVFFLALATLGFAGASLCGAVFTLTSLPALFGTSHGENYAAGILVISVPSLLIGGLLCRWCWRMAQRVHAGSKGGSEG